MKHLLIILSILLLSSPLFAQETGLLYIWKNGTMYIDEWKNGKKHGQGTQTYISGKKVVGVWVKNGLVKGETYDKDGNIVE